MASSILNLCEFYYGNRDLYKLMNLTKYSTEEDVKRAYYRLSLQVHPDRVAENYKVEATEKFKILTKIKKVLSDPVSKSLYDDKGIILDDEESSIAEASNLSDTTDNLILWRQFFKPISEIEMGDIRNKYKGSSAEIKRIYESYQKGKGCMTYIIENVPFISTQDEPRITALIKGWIAEGRVLEYERFLNEPVLKRNRRYMKYGRPITTYADHQSNFEQFENPRAISLANVYKQPCFKVEKNDVLHVANVLHVADPGMISLAIVKEEKCDEKNLLIAENTAVNQAAITLDPDAIFAIAENQPNSNRDNVEKKDNHVEGNIDTSDDDEQIKITICMTRSHIRLDFPRDEKQKPSNHVRDDGNTVDEKINNRTTTRMTRSRAKVATTSNRGGDNEIIDDDQIKKENTTTRMTRARYAKNIDKKPSIADKVKAAENVDTVKGSKKYDASAVGQAKGNSRITRKTPSKKDKKPSKAAKIKAAENVDSVKENKKKKNDASVVEQAKGNSTTRETSLKKDKKPSMTDKVDAADNVDRDAVRVDGEAEENSQIGRITRSRAAKNGHN